MNIIKKRDKRIIYRRQIKQRYDEMIDLSASDDGIYVPLLDEGAIVRGDDVDSIIKKGTLAAFVESLPDDFEGAIKMGHLDFVSQFPILLGTWTKSDLRIVEIGNGRMGLDVRMNLNRDLNIVQDLLAMPYTLGISGELQVEYDESWSRRLKIPVIDRVWMENFGVVGDAGNIRSSGIDLRRTQ